MGKVFPHYIAPVPGTHRYFAEVAEGFQIIRTLRRAVIRADRAPMYVAGAWDEEYGDWEPVENTAPHDAAHDAMRVAWDHPRAAGILRAWGHSPAVMMDMAYFAIADRLPR